MIRVTPPPQLLVTPLPLALLLTTSRLLTILLAVLLTNSYLPTTDYSTSHATHYPSVSHCSFRILTICKNPDTQLLYCTCSVLSFLGEESEGDQFRIDTRGDCSAEMGRIAGWLVIIFGKRDWGEEIQERK